MSYCVATIDGNLTEDPRPIKLGDKDAVEISIAINYLFKGERQASFFRAVFFEPREVDYILKTAKKGSRITIQADVKTSKKENVTYTNYTGTRILQLFTPTAPTSQGITANEVESAPVPAKVAPKPAPKAPANLTPVEPDDDPFPF